MKRKPTVKKPTARQRAEAEALWASPDMANLSKFAENLLAVPKAEYDALPDESRKRHKTQSATS